jgi:hypothetical protein
MFTPTDNFVRGGELKVERAVEVYSKFYGSNRTEDISTYFISEILD